MSTLFESMLDEPHQLTHQEDDEPIVLNVPLQSLKHVLSYCECINYTPAKVMYKTRLQATP